MNRPLIWLAGADADLQRIFDSLEDRLEGAGKNFLGRVETYLGRISRFPEIAPLYVRRVRRQVMAHSVYGIFMRSSRRASWSLPCWIYARTTGKSSAA